MRRDYINVGILWFALTFIGELLVPTLSLLPPLASEQGVYIDRAYSFLLAMAVPVAAFVISVLVYSIFRFRDRGEAEGTGPVIRSNTGLYVAWLIITGGLAVTILIHPGITGIAELRAHNEADLVVEVTAEQWNWSYAYPESGVTIENARELVLPVDTTIKFVVTATDVVHSFWVPAFRMKIDAVPGQTTVMYVTPTETGTFADESTLRVQCAELCGTGHANMLTGLLVMEPAEFDEWIASQAMASNSDMGAASQ